MDSTHLSPLLKFLRCLLRFQTCSRRKALAGAAAEYPLNTFERQKSESLMHLRPADECCDVCGDVGVVDALITCGICNLSQEHMYCMRTLLLDYPEVWYCEICESNSKSVLTESCPNASLISQSKLPNPTELYGDGSQHGKTGKLPVRSRKGSLNWEKAVASGKTKYICVQEAIKLSSGAKKSVTPLKVNHHLSPPRSKAGISKPERTPFRPKTTALNILPRKDFASGCSQQLNPQRLFESQQQLPKNESESQRSRSIPPAKATEEALVRKGQWGEVDLSQKAKVTTTDTSPKSAPLLDVPPITLSSKSGNDCSAAKPRTCSDENARPSADLRKASCAPASDALWKGSFSIRNDIVVHSELTLGFQAHPPSLVRRKVYEFSKRMPETLCFKLVSLNEFWIHFFPDHSPDKRDIGLYFFPSDGERGDDSLSLMEAISIKNLALRIQIADIELLIFSSQLLTLDCQYHNGKKFLWGVFHRLKGAAISGAKISFSTPCRDDANWGQSHVDDSEDVDMDIDMIGGVDMGPIDIPVRKEPTAREPVRFNIRSVAKRLSSPLTSFKSSTTKIPSSDITREICDDIPPGFDEKFQLRLHNPPLVQKNPSGGGN